MSICGKYLVIAVLIAISASWPTKRVPTSVEDIGPLTFLICVNDTWGDCMTTVKTLPISPDTPYNKSDRIQVGDCDSGPLTFTTSKTEDGDIVIDLVFYSSVIMDASHPECKISWNYNYLVPNHGGSMDSLLPGCFVADSREGYHMTYYWFFILDW
jgi:secretion-regulating guanine nucleotide exchange factor